MSLLQELKRRNVFRVAIAYALGAWVLLQIVDFTMQVIVAPDWILQTFTLVALLGLPVAVIISWVFEMTPEGIKRESDIDRNQSVTTQTGQKLGTLIVVFLALAVVFLLVDKFVAREDISKQPSTSTEAVTDPADGAVQTMEQSIAVLPFVNMSADPDQEFFSDGISEEILNVLTHIPNLKVAARTSSFQFKGKSLDISDIGQQLQVEHILEGSVRTAGGQVRITAQLIQVKDGFHLWSRTFDRELQDVFAIQDEIANAIAVELRATFTSDGAATSTPVDLNAYQHYLKGRGLVASRGEANILLAIDELKAALEIAPDYSAAMSSLGVAYTTLPWYSSSIPTGEAREIARAFAEKALEIDPYDVEAMSALGIILSQTDLDWSGAEQYHRRSLELGPANATANNFYGDFLLRMGDLDQALIYESRAAELDPLAAVQWMDLANVYQVDNQPYKALEIIKRALELDGSFENSVYNFMRSSYAIGDLDAMRKQLAAVKASSEFHPSLASLLQMWIHVAEGEIKEARNILYQRDELVNRGELSAPTAAINGAFLGEFDISGQLLKQAVAEGDGTWQFPGLVRLPEQAPDSQAWQEFWALPGVAELAEIRRRNGFTAHIPEFGELKDQPH